MIARIRETDRPRFALTAAVLDLWCNPDSYRYLRFARSLIVFYGRAVSSSSHYEIARPALFLDVLGLTTEFDYFLSFPP